MKKPLIAICLVGINLVAFANDIQKDVLYDDGGSSAAHEWWVYLVVMPVAIAAYALLGWLAFKAGKYWWLAMLTIFGLFWLGTGNAGLAFGLMFGVGLGFGVVSQRADEEDRYQKRKALEDQYAEKFGDSWRFHWHADHGIERHKKFFAEKALQADRATSRDQPPKGYLAIRTEPTDQELVDMAAASPHRDLIRQAIRSGEQEESDLPPVPNSEGMEQQDEPDGRVSLLTKEVMEDRKWLEEQGIYLSPCFWIRNEEASSDEPSPTANEAAEKGKLS